VGVGALLPVVDHHFAVLASSSHVVIQSLPNNSVSGLDLESFFARIVVDLMGVDLRDTDLSRAVLIMTTSLTVWILALISHC
jgi:hypothetical protein